MQKTGILLQHASRKSDFAFRYVGDEFVIIMPETNSHDGLLLANRLCQSIQQSPLTKTFPNLTISMSSGVASVPSHVKNGEDLVRFADMAVPC